MRICLTSVLLLILCFYVSICLGGTFFRTYDFYDGQEMFVVANELSPDSIALLHDESDPPFNDGVLIVNGEGDSLRYGESLAYYIACADLLDRFVITWPTGAGIRATWIDIYGNTLDSVDVALKYWDYIIDDINPTADGGYCIAGDYFTAKIDQSGVLEWEYPGDWNILVFECIAEGEDGSFLAGVNGSQQSCIKLSSSGDFIWQYPIDDNEMEPESAVGTPDSGYVMGTGYGNIYKLSADGDSLWCYNDPNTIWFNDLIACGDNLIASGIAVDSTFSVLTKLDNAGNLIWEREYPDCAIYSLIEAMDGGFILTGYYPYPYSFDNTALVIKTDSLGWWGGTGMNPEAQSDVISDLVICPNPSSGFPVAEFSLTESESFDIVIFDISGRIVQEIIEDDYSEGNHEIRLEGLSSGAYFLRVIAGMSTATQSFVVIQ